MFWNRRRVATTPLFSSSLYTYASLCFYSSLVSRLRNPPLLLHRSSKSTRRSMLSLFLFHSLSVSHFFGFRWIFVDFFLLKSDGEKHAGEETTHVDGGSTHLAGESTVWVSRRHSFSFRRQIAPGNSVNFSIYLFTNESNSLWFLFLKIKFDSFWYLVLTNEFDSFF